MLDKTHRILVTGGTGLAGSAILKELCENGHTNLHTTYLKTEPFLSHKIKSYKIDLRNQAKTHNLFENVQPKYVIHAAAKVGGIVANRDHPVDFLQDNLQIQNNVIHNCYQYNVIKFIFLASSCFYPKEAPQPIKESDLLTGPLEPTNESYALAKISGLKLCESYNKQFQTNFTTLIPCNLYGPHDNYDLQSSHVLPALIRKISQAKNKQEPSLTLWGSGKPLREFLHSSDLAKACLFALNNINSDIVNVGTGEEVSIYELANLIKNEMNYPGEIKWDTSYPDGTFRKCLDHSKLINLGWKPSMNLKEGLKRTIQNYINQSYS